MLPPFCTCAPRFLPQMGGRGIRTSVVSLGTTKPSRGRSQLLSTCLREQVKRIFLNPYLQRTAGFVTLIGRPTPAQGALQVSPVPSALSLARWFCSGESTTVRTRAAARAIGPGRDYLPFRSLWAATWISFMKRGNPGIFGRISGDGHRLALRLS